jgi:hypothetical protein
VDGEAHDAGEQEDALAIVPWCPFDEGRPCRGADDGCGQAGREPHACDARTRNQKCGDVAQVLGEFVSAIRSDDLIGGFFGADRRPEVLDLGSTTAYRMNVLTSSRRLDRMQSIG